MPIALNDTNKINWTAKYLITTSVLHIGLFRNILSLEKEKYIKKNKNKIHSC